MMGGSVFVPLTSGSERYKNLWIRNIAFLVLPPPPTSITITEKAVREKIQNLKTDSAAGPDEIGPKLLQELESVVTKPLTWIFRESINSGVVPAEWRSANVTPIFKKGANSDPGNDRPVS